MASICVAEDLLVGAVVVLHPAIDVTALVWEARQPVSTPLPTIITWLALFFIASQWFVRAVWALGAQGILSV